MQRATRENCVRPTVATHVTETSERVRSSDVVGSPSLPEPAQQIRERRGGEGAVDVVVVSVGVRAPDDGIAACRVAEVAREVDEAHATPCGRGRLDRRIVRDRGSARNRAGVARAGRDDGVRQRRRRRLTGRRAVRPGSHRCGGRSGRRRHIAEGRLSRRRRPRASRHAEPRATARAVRQARRRPQNMPGFIPVWWVRCKRRQVGGKFTAEHVRGLAFGQTRGAEDAEKARFARTKRRRPCFSSTTLKLIRSASGRRVSRR